MKDVHSIFFQNNSQFIKFLCKITTQTFSVLSWLLIYDEECLISDVNLGWRGERFLKEGFGGIILGVSTWKLKELNSLTVVGIFIIIT